MRPESGRSWPSLRPGFTLLEVLLAMLLSIAVLVSLLGMLNAQNNRTAHQREQSDTWLTLRSALAVMTFELRQSGGPDLLAITDSSFTVRSRQASGVICAKSATAAAYAVTGVTGTFTANAGDSVLVMTVETTPVWKMLGVAAAGSPGAIGPSACIWTGSAAPTAGVRFTVGTAADTALITVGSAVHAFRTTQYGITSHSGRRWLGRRVAGSTTWELLTGPLATNGLAFTYHNAAGVATTNPAQVASVRVSLVGESFGQNSRKTLTHDSLSVRVQLRN
jgi:Tfp pilus assembly protein PilV